ncbi:MAG TPA: ClbS/DfsB family four-helix bundle protein [Anaerolineales bacterium]|nr:ClbS/DfsB family four-helix bundle protein [Anaerolineales bacterium]
MTITKTRTIDYIVQEWGTYVERFQRLPKDEQEKRVNDMGYDRFRDMLAHILAWWDEGMEIITAVTEDRPLERKQYDFDLFNAEAVANYKDWDEAEFMSHFEKTRQKMGTDLKSMNEALFENRRVQAWLHAVIYHHAREHLVTLSRFIVIDLLENEWATYINDFNDLSDEKKKEFLSKQGFDTFHDLLAHVIGWWEEGARIITGIIDSPAFTWDDLDADEFNLELVEKYSIWSENDLFAHYEAVRVAMLELTIDLPGDAFLNKDIEQWLADDVVGHYDEHPIPASR